MTATLREYKSGKLRKRLWLRYDNAVRTLLEFCEKFEMDEQAAANALFRTRYRLVLAKLQELTQEASNGVSDRTGVSGAVLPSDDDGKRLVGG